MLQNAAPALALLVIMVVMAVVLQRFRRHIPGAATHGGPKLQVLSTLSLGPQQRVVTVQVGQGEDAVCLVLGVAAGGVQALHQMPLPPEALNPVETSAPTGFAARLAQMTQPRKASYAKN
ncbi:flagellar biosynthetic protein FliO [Hydrogenophaga sp.]|uniref:FliO/MopB family protein n=1 Tax=Hydrogenophaga sp. TaxID=1904254 RepID=UPI00271B6AF3|nr:flagellar biosynthetic protein FliO [Hydrogenophaga sp.]MDO8905526.1 flagellar biosynthetic protein FliO [Hydrogenophaga sp.]